jgi:phosphoglycerol transferase MdoB-like AlkP superfamily enzyme
MRMYLSETGFTSVMGGDAFPSSLYSSAWGVPDEHLLQPNLLPQEEPFFAAALTLSSHEPWEVPMHRLDNYKRNAFAYTDSCLGAFLDGLKASDQWKNMLIIVIPDHGIPFVEGQPTSDIAVARIPMLWTGGAVREAKTIEHLCSQSDLAATLLCQMGVSAKEFPFSRNVLGTKYLERRQFAMHSDKNCLNLVFPEGCWHYDCISRTLQPADSNNALFVEALLQRLYKTTATL